MEKRALLAALLSGIVLVIWYAFVMPSQPRRGSQQVASPTPASSQAPATVPPTASAGLAEAPPEAPPATPARPAVAGEAEEEVVLEGRGWRASVSSRGAVIRSLTLAEYRDEKGNPLDLAGGEGPLSIAGPGPWNDSLYAVAREGSAVILRWSDGKGSWVEKRLAPGRGAYGLEAEVRAGGEPARLGVRVGVGVGGRGTSAARGNLGVAGAVIRANGKLQRVKAEKLERPEEVRGAIEFAGMEDQYFLLILLPEGEVDRVRVERAQGKEGAVAEVAVVGAGGLVRGTLYAGPKEQSALEAYGRGLQDTLSFGIFGILSFGFLAALRWIHSWSGNWGVAIILLTAAIRVLLFPLTHKSTVAMRRMQTLQPRLKAIQERYQERAKRDPQVRTRMNQEVMQLYKQEGVNPLGGCLPTLVQLPILWALYTLFAYAIELRQAPLALWIKDLSLKDPTYITPVLMTISMVAQQRLTPQVGDPAQRRLFMLMPFIFGFMFMNFPSGLVLYWLVNNVLTIGQQLLTQRLLAKQPTSG